MKKIVVLCYGTYNESNNWEPSFRVSPEFDNGSDEWTEEAVHINLIDEHGNILTTLVKCHVDDMITKLRECDLDFHEQYPGEFRDLEITQSYNEMLMWMLNNGG